MAQALQTEPLGRRAAKVLILAGQSFNGVAAFALVSAMPAMAKHFANGGDGAFFAQMVVVAPAISIVVGSPLAGQLAKRVGPRNVALLSLTIYVLAGIVGLAGPGRTPLIISRVLLGLSASFLSALTIAKASDFPEEERGSLIGIGAAIASLTAIISLVAGGWLTTHFGWNAAFILYLWPVPLFPFALLGMDRKTPAAASGGIAARFPVSAVAPIYMLTLLWAVMTFAPAIEGPFILTSRGMTSSTGIGIIIGLNGLLASGASASYGWISTRLGVNGQMRLVFSTFVVSGLIVALVTQILPTEIGLIIPGICTGLVGPVIVPMLLKRLAPQHAATALGIFMSTVYLSQLLDPFLFELIRSYSPVKTFGVIAITAAICLAVMLLQNARFTAQPQSRAT